MIIVKLFLVAFAGLILFFFFGLWHLKRSLKQAEKEIRKIKTTDIPFLAEECIRVFQQKLGTKLDLNQYEESTRAVDRWIKTEDIKRVFSRSDFYWYFVAPVGAFIGELARQNGKGEWKESEGHGPSLLIGYGETEVIMYPFDKVLKQVTSGRSGDIVAYLMVEKRLLTKIEVQ